jgi:glycopeptide antibiotics resistance protein
MVLGIGASFFVSLTFETVQWIFSIGVSDITDLIGNTLGSGVGAVLFAFFGKIFPKKRMSMINGIGAVVEMVGIALLSMLFVTNK